MNSVHSPDALNFRNFTGSAAWPETRLNHEQYVAMGGTMSDWCAMPGWRLETTSWDFMHNCYLGIGRDVVGSGLKLFIRQGVYPLGDGIDEIKALAKIQKDMVKDCHEHGSSSRA